MALVFHELMTNSAKYGALSDSGTVHVEWRLDSDGDLRIEWREQGGPAVQPPRRQGFGTTIIQRSIPYDLGGRAEVRYVLTGLEADFCVPARHVVVGDSSRAPVAAINVSREEATHRAVLAGTVLLVEDSLIIAMDAEDLLTRLGAERVVTAASIAQALQEIQRDAFEVAVLDVNLGNDTSLPVADALSARGIPYVFATGYGEQLRLPEQHAGAQVIQKPYTLTSISAALVRALGVSG